MIVRTGEPVVEDENFEEFLDFDEGDDLEPELAAALSNEDRQKADKNCLEFDGHVAQVSSSGLTVGPFRTPIEPCTSSNFNFNYSFGLCWSYGFATIAEHVNAIVAPYLNIEVRDCCHLYQCRRSAAGVHSQGLLYANNIQNWRRYFPSE